ncbi:hypothetical protein ACVWZW_005022 [Bradyrhizobium sp. F1.13.4]
MHHPGMAAPICAKIEFETVETVLKRVVGGWNGVFEKALGIIEQTAVPQYLLPMRIDAAGFGFGAGGEEILPSIGGADFGLCVGKRAPIQTEAGFPSGLVAGQQPLGDHLVDGAIDVIDRIIGAKFLGCLATCGNR